MKGYDCSQIRSSIDSVITNQNLCESYLSEHTFTLKKKIKAPVVKLRKSQTCACESKMAEIERTNKFLVETIARYNADLDESFLEKNTMQKNIQELQSRLSKDKVDLSVQTVGCAVQTLSISSYEIERMKTPEQSNLFDKEYTLKQNNLVAHQTTPSPKLQLSDNGTPNEIDCEYFVSKRHIEKMMGSITTRVRKLKDNIKKSYPQTLTPDSIVSSLNELSEQIRFLRVLIDDQLIDIRRYAEEIHLESTKQIASIHKQPNYMSTNQQNKDLIIYNRNQKPQQDNNYCINTQNYQISQKILSQSNINIPTSPQIQSFDYSIQNFEITKTSHAPISQISPEINSTNEMQPKQRIHSISKANILQSESSFDQSNSKNKLSSHQQELITSQAKKLEFEQEVQGFQQLGEIADLTQSNSKSDFHFLQNGSVQNLNQYNGNPKKKPKAFCSIGDSQNYSPDLLKTLGDDEFDLDDLQCTFENDQELIGIRKLRIPPQEQDKSRKEQKNIVTFSFGENNPVIQTTKFSEQILILNEQIKELKLINNNYYEFFCKLRLQVHSQGDKMILQSDDEIQKIVIRRLNAYQRNYIFTFRQ